MINGNSRILKWRYVSTIFLTIFCGDIPLHRPEKQALYMVGTFNRFLKWPLISCKAHNKPQLFKVHEETQMAMWFVWIVFVSRSLCFIVAMYSEVSRRAMTQACRSILIPQTQQSNDHLQTGPVFPHLWIWLQLLLRFKGFIKQNQNTWPISQIPCKTKSQLVTKQIIPYQKTSQDQFLPIQSVDLEQVCFRVFSYLAC